MQRKIKASSEKAKIFLSLMKETKSGEPVNLICLLRRLLIITFCKHFCTGFLRDSPQHRKISSHFSLEAGPLI